MPFFYPIAFHQFFNRRNLHFPGCSKLHEIVRDKVEVLIVPLPLQSELLPVLHGMIDGFNDFIQRASVSRHCPEVVGVDEAAVQGASGIVRKEVSAKCGQHVSLGQFGIEGGIVLGIFVAPEAWAWVAEPLQVGEVFVHVRSSTLKRVKIRVVEPFCRFTPDRPSGRHHFLQLTVGEPSFQHHPLRILEHFGDRAVRTDHIPLLGLGEQMGVDARKIVLAPDGDERLRIISMDKITEIIRS